MALPSGFHGVSRGEQAAMLMNVIAGALSVCTAVITLTGKRTTVSRGQKSGSRQCSSATRLDGASITSS